MESSSHQDRVQWFAETIRSVAQRILEGDIAVILKRDGRVVSFSVSERDD